MTGPIEWKCIGDEYLLMQGAQRRVVSSEQWWATIKGAAPSPEELEQLWRSGAKHHDQESPERTTAYYLLLAEELRRYVADTQAELNRLKTEMQSDAAEEETLGASMEELERQEALLESTREQLRQVEAELSRRMN